MSATDIIGLSAAEAAREIAAGSLSSEELFEAYRLRAAADELNCFTWVADGPPGEPSSDSDDGGASLPEGPLQGVPLAVKDLFCTEGIPSQSGSKILEGYLPPKSVAPAPVRCETAVAV